MKNLLAALILIIPLSPHPILGEDFFCEFKSGHEYHLEGTILESFMVLYYVDGNYLVKQRLVTNRDFTRNTGTWTQVSRVSHASPSSAREALIQETRNEGYAVMREESTVELTVRSGFDIRNGVEYYRLDKHRVKYSRSERLYTYKGVYFKDGYAYYFTGAVRDYLLICVYHDPDVNQIVVSETRMDKEFSVPIQEEVTLQRIPVSGNAITQIDRVTNLLKVYADYRAENLVEIPVYAKPPREYDSVRYVFKIRMRVYRTLKGDMFEYAGG